MFKFYSYASVSLNYLQLVIHWSIGLVNLLLNSKMRWLEKLKTLNPWSLIGVLSVGIAIVLSVTKGFNGERALIGVLGLALLFNLFD